MRLFLLSTVFFATTVFTALGQEQIIDVKERTTIHEIGVNATFFISNYLTFNGNNTVVADPFAVQYKVLFKGTDGIRFGIGGSYQSQTQTGINTNEVTKKESTVAVRFGYEHRQTISPKWQIFYGIDGIYGHSEKKNETVYSPLYTTLSTDNRDVYGGGPVFGIMFYAGKRISLGTEMSAQAWYASSSSNQFNGGGGISQPSKTEEVGFSFQLPTSIFVNIRLGKRK